jgi:acid phosphatase class B
LIAVDEIINMPFLEYSRYKNTFDDYFDDYTKSKYYWEEVKNEIKKYEIKR